MLNLNWEKIHSIILSFTCHGFRNFPLLIHIPPYPFVNFQNPMSGVGWGESYMGVVGWSESHRGGVGWVMQ